MAVISFFFDTMTDIYDFLVLHTFDRNNMFYSQCIFSD
jgi:hypothetical protein